MDKMFETLIKKLKDGNYITLETTPGHSATIEPIISKIKELELDKKIDGFSVTDNPLARLKYSSLFAALKLQQKFKKPVIATITMRDRNKLSLQSDLLGANDANIRAILALTGDSATASDQPNTKGVFESDSSLLLDIIKCFNSGIDYAGKPFKEKPLPTYPFAVSNSYANKPSHLIKKMAKKIEHGAIGIITQPIFDKENAIEILEYFNEAKKSRGNSDSWLIFGFFPITKLRTAQFLASHVHGVKVPKIWLEKLHEAKNISEEEEYRVGLKLSLECFSDIFKINPRIHIMTANNFELAAKILS